MTPALHAEDLLDKEARGDLARAERVRLNRHVAACPVCRFERQLRDDFRLERCSSSARPGRATGGGPKAAPTLSPGTRAAEPPSAHRPTVSSPAEPPSAHRPTVHRSTAFHLHWVLLLVAATVVAGTAGARWTMVSPSVDQGDN